jgi:hypothetical protein
MPSFSDDDLDAVYTAFCKTMTTLGPETSALFMARFALLAMTALGDRALLERMIADAANDLVTINPHPTTP